MCDLPLTQKPRLSKTYTDLILDGLAYGPLTKEQFYGNIAHLATKYLAPNLYEDPIQNYVTQDIPNDQDPSKYAYYQRKLKEMSRYRGALYNVPAGPSPFRTKRSSWKKGYGGRIMAYRSRWGSAQSGRRRKFQRGYNRTSGYYGRFHTHRKPELKFHDFQLNDSVVAAGFTVFPSINLIPQGTTEITRIGRACTIKSIWWKFHCLKRDGTASNTTHDVIRMVMYLDTQCNGAAAGLLDLFEVDDFQTFRNLANSHRFKILVDQTIDLNSYTGAGNGTTNEYGAFGKSGQIYKKVNIPLEFNGVTGAITEVRSNNVGIMLISEHGTVQFESQFRLRFMG